MSQNITKADRQHIVSQKLSEVVSDENERLRLQKIAIMDKMAGKADKAQKKAISAVMAYEQRIHKMIAKVSLPESLFLREDHQTVSKVMDPASIIGNNIDYKSLYPRYHGKEILQQVLRWRTHENKRIRTVCKAGMEILVGADTAKMEAFLNL
tara:strand:- start:240 stop:698 length:459 start_codon:yes stop_codon:yes gene_type:complete